MIVTLAAKATPSTIDLKLAELAGDGGTHVIAVEVYDHPNAVHVNDRARFGGDKGPGVLGAWVLGPEKDVYAYLAEHNYVEYDEQYSAGYEER